MPLKLYPPGSRKGNRFWIVRGSVNGSREIEISTNATDENAARRFAAAIEVKLRDEGGVDTSRPARGFRAIAEKRMLARPPSKQDRADIERLIGHFGNTDVADITEGDIHIAAHKLCADKSNATKNRHAIAPAVTILHFAAREKLCDWIRCEKLPAELPPPRDMNLDQAAKLFQAVDVAAPANDGQDLRPMIRALLVLLFFHGPRISEALALTWQDDIDLVGRRWRKGVLKKKGGRQFIWKPMSEDLFLALANLPGAHETGHIFPWRSRWQVYDSLAPISEAAGIKFTPHMARHTFTQVARDLGADTAALQALNDWSNPAMPGRYSRVGAEEQSRFLNAVGEAIRGKVLKLLA